MAPVSCNLCSSLGVETKFRTLDGRKTHAQIHASQLKNSSEDDGDRMSLKQVFVKCFPLDDFDKPKEIDNSRLELDKICASIIQANKNESQSIKCQVCKSDVRYANYDGRLNIIQFLTHACRHSTKKPFVCRHCQYETVLKTRMEDHISRMHKIASPIADVHFDECWSDCLDEIKDALTKSFGSCLVLNPDLNQKFLTPPRLVLNLDLSSKFLSPPRELSIGMAYSKILKCAIDPERIRCRQCRKELHPTSTSDLKKHVRWHLTYYLATKRGGPSKEGHNDHSDGHNEEMGWLEKCFGKVTSK